MEQRDVYQRAGMEPGLVIVHLVRQPQPERHPGHLPGCDEPVPAQPASDGGDGALVKANWNYAMSNNDGSRGLHNPAFTTQMLQEALNAVNAIQ